MTPKTIAWIRLVATALATFCGVAGGSLAGGCKVGIAILTGIGAGASAVLHGLSQSPNQTDNTETKDKP